MKNFLTILSIIALTTTISFSQSESNNGIYTSGDNRITINGSSWSSIVVIVSDFGSQYNETLRDNGIVNGDNLYDDSGYVKIGSISSYPSKSITTTLGGNRITLLRKD